MQQRRSEAGRGRAAGGIPGRGEQIAELQERVETLGRVVFARQGAAADPHDCAKRHYEDDRRQIPGHEIGARDQHHGGGNQRGRQSLKRARGDDLRTGAAARAPHEFFQKSEFRRHGVFFIIRERATARRGPANPTLRFELVWWMSVVLSMRTRKTPHVLENALTESLVTECFRRNNE